VTGQRLPLLRKNVNQVVYALQKQGKSDRFSRAERGRRNTPQLILVALSAGCCSLRQLRIVRALIDCQARNGRVSQNLAKTLGVCGFELVCAEPCGADGIGFGNDDRSTRVETR
jgi:hypothetical protein